MSVVLKGWEDDGGMWKGWWEVEIEEYEKAWVGSRGGKKWKGLRRWRQRVEVEARVEGTNREAGMATGMELWLKRLVEVEVEEAEPDRSVEVEDSGRNYEGGRS